jgi:hypothetical protein
MRDSIRSLLASAPLLAIVFGVGLAMSACDTGGDDSPPTCPEGCGPNMVCQSDGSCACAPGLRDCDGEASNGCEHQGDTCNAPCVRESDSAFCRRLGKTCGDVKGTDNCGGERKAACGSCGDGQECGGDNLCHAVCTKEADTTFCARLGKTCGDVTGKDNCGNARSATCGTCPDGQACGVENTCVCKAEPDAAFCTRLAKSCGGVTDTDNCGDARSADCGTCNVGLVCASNLCCQPEDDAAFCSRQAKQCGSFAGTDNCGQPRTADCGTCAGNETCGSNVPNICGPCVGETDAELCLKANATCGQIRATDRCGAARVVTDCGACAGGAACLTGNTCGTPDGVWLHGTCSKYSNTVVACATGLQCIIFYRAGKNWEGVCKQPCESDAECTTGGSCATVGATDGHKFCGKPRSPGDACTSWTSSADVCHDPSRPADTFLECLAGTCSYVCDYEGNLGAPPYSCLAGQTCSDSRVRYPLNNLNLNLCQ